MTTDTKLNQLIINKLTQEQYDEAKAAGTLSDTELYITDSDDDALTNNKISNCITYIPQDIKLELNNGTLTLKAGSKVYIQNGFEIDGTTKKYDIHIISSDKVIRYSSKFNDLVIITDINDNFFIASTSYTVSGATQPTDISRRNIWYDTTANKVKTNSPTTSNFETNKSLPIVIVNCIDVNKFTISQVFNGFGYIGSTVFALPGVKGRIPNGRKADGSLKSTEAVLTGVQTTTVNPGNGSFSVRIGNNFIAVGVFPYDEKTNFNYNASISPSNIREQFNAGTVEYSLGKVISLTPKTVFHALDYNDKSTISGWSMPSGRFIDLTLGASGSTYTAPANGYYCLYGKSGIKADFAINFGNVTSHFRECISGNTWADWVSTYIPVKKGDIVMLLYNNITTSSHIFRFIYAEGENV